jgi:hypothetical protein
MATEAAWLDGNRLTERRKRKSALTSTGLLMEGPKTSCAQWAKKIICFWSTVAILLVSKRMRRGVWNDEEVRRTGSVVLSL